MVKIKFEDLPIYALGIEIEIQGIILEGHGKNILMKFPNSNIELIESSLEIIENAQQDQWNKFMQQSDLLEVEMFPNDKSGQLKKVVRKTQRQIEQFVSWNVFRRDNYTCRYCGNNKVPLTVDHIILWENMGPSIEGNLNSSCKHCNKTRGNMEYLEFLETKFYKERSKNISEEVKQLNITCYEIAKKLPLRKSERSR